MVLESNTSTIASSASLLKTLQWRVTETICNFSSIGESSIGFDSHWWLPLMINPSLKEPWKHLRWPDVDVQFLILAKIDASFSLIHPFLKCQFTTFIFKLKLSTLRRGDYTEISSSVFYRRFTEGWNFQVESFCATHWFGWFWSIARLARFGKRVCSCAYSNDRRSKLKTFKRVAHIDNLSMTNDEASE